MADGNSDKLYHDPITTGTLLGMVFAGSLVLVVMILIFRFWWYGKLPWQRHCRGCQFSKKGHRFRGGIGRVFMDDLEDNDTKRVWKLGPWKVGGRVGRCVDKSEEGGSV